MPNITVVTGNTKKFNQIQEALSHHGISVERAAIELEEIQADSGEEVVRDKVQKAFAQINGPVLVDDSGIYFDTYSEFPGIYSKFVFQSIGYEGLMRLYDEGDGAAFISYVGYMDDSQSGPQIFRGEAHGTLTRDFEQPENPEMPYAPFFISDGHTKPIAQESPEERATDHRHNALNAFAQWYNNRRI